MTRNHLAVYRLLPIEGALRAILSASVTATIILVAMVDLSAQSYTREIDSGERVSLEVRNLSGRVSVVAAEDQTAKVSITAVSSGGPVTEREVVHSSSGGTVKIEVKPRRASDRIDLTVRVPARSKIKVETDAGMVDVVGSFISAEVVTDTGTIHTDVPTDAVKLDLFWTASRPRVFSEMPLPKVKEKRAGVYVINGRLGDKKAKKEDSVALSFTTQRGLVIFNVDPAMVPSDLRERPLTEAARAVVRSGDPELSDAVRKVAPKMFKDFAETLPARVREPSLVQRNAVSSVATSPVSQVVRINASVTDSSGRAISGLDKSDFEISENGESRAIDSVAPTTTPFNLVLLLDVSGSVEERIDFIRKAARNFLAATNPQDRIAILSFREDIQIISSFTTDRSLLSKRLDDIDAGGATALYDALAYALVDTLKPLRGARTAIVVMSDGDDNKSFVPFGALLKAMTESGAMIYPLYIPSGLIPESSVPIPTTTLDPTRTRYLTLTTRAEEEGQKLASVSGGVYYPIRRIEDLQRAYDDVVKQLRTAYTITYISELNGTNGRRVRLRTTREGALIRLSPAVAAP